MDGNFDFLIDGIAEVTGDKSVLKMKAPPKPKIPGEDVARVVDDELIKLGWSANARLSFLGDVGRENNWNRKTIFGGHPDPKNQEFNRGIISWQGDRRVSLDNYLKKQGVFGRGDDEELRAMVRFADEEMRGSDEWKGIADSMRNPNISTYDASENLRKYIKYVPNAPYNTYDPEFRVKNNAEWAKRARELGLGKQADWSFLTEPFNQTEGSKSWDFLQTKEPLPAGQLAPEPAQKDWSFLTDVFDKPEAPPDTKPVPESGFTINAQLKSAFDPASPRSAVLLTEADQINQIPPEMANIFMPVNTKNGTVMVNKEKAKKRGLKNPEQIYKYIEENGFAKLIGKQDDVGNNTADGLALRTETPGGRELSTSMVITPTTAIAQAQNDRAEFGEGVNQQIAPAQAAAAMRENEVATDRHQPAEDNTYGGHFLPPGAPEKVSKDQAEVQAKYDEFLKVTGLPNSDESIKEFNLAQKVSVEGANKQNLADSQGRSAPVATASPGRKTAPPPPPQQFAPPVINAPKNFAPASKESYDREILGTSPFSKSYAQKPSLDQVFNDIIVDQYGQGIFGAMEAYRDATGENLIEPAPGLQQDIDDYYKDGKYEFPSNPIYAKVRSAVEKFNQGGEPAITEWATRNEPKLKGSQIATSEDEPQDKSIAADQYPLKTDDELWKEADKTISAPWSDEFQPLTDLSNYVKSFFGSSDKGIQQKAEFDRLKDEQKYAEKIWNESRLSDEEKASIGNISNNLNEYGVLGSGIGSVLGAGSRIQNFVSGTIARPLSWFGRQLGIDLDNPYTANLKQSQVLSAINQATKGEGLKGDLADILIAAPYDIPRIYALSRLPGGAVVGFAAESGLQSAGSGADLPEVGKQTAIGGALGLILSGTGKLSRMVESGILNKLLTPTAVQYVEAGLLNTNFSNPVARRVLVSKLFGLGTRLGTIGPSVYAFERAIGEDHDKAFHQAIIFTLLDVTFQAKELKNIAGLTGKIYRMSGKNGETANVTVDPDGTVRLLKGTVPDEVIDAEFVVDNAKPPKQYVEKDFIDTVENNGEFVAKGASERGETPEADQPESGGFREKDINNRPQTPVAEIGEAPTPKRLEANNPRRIDSASREAVQKAKIDTRAQKVAESLADGQPKTLEELQKATRYNQNNLLDTIDLLYEARNIEILPDNSVRLINELPKTETTDLYEKYADRRAPIELPKSTFEGELKLLNETILPESPRALDKTENVSPAKPTEKYVPPDEIETSELGRLDKEFKAKEKERTEAEAEDIQAKTAKIADRAVGSDLPEQTVFTERGTKTTVRPKVVPVEDLITSLDDGYPQEFQPRDRSRSASVSQISDIAGKLNPELLGDSPKASDGRPLVVPVEVNGEQKYAVISGNGRTAAIREAYHSGNEGSLSYAKYVRAKDPKANASRPVYVGVLNPKEIKDFAEYAKEANESPVASMSATEQAKADAERLDSDILSQFVPADDGSIHAAANRDFIRAFMKRNVGQSEQGRLMDAQGNLNQDGVNRVRNAIFAKAYGGTDAGLAAVQQIAESTDNNVRRITNALLQSAGNFTVLKQAITDGVRFDGLDITPDITASVAKFSYLRSENTPVETYLRQHGLFGDDLSPLQKYVLQVFDKHSNSAKAISGILDNYILAANALGDPRQSNLFGGVKQIDTASIFRAAVLEYEAGNYVETTDQTSIFDIAKDQGAEIRPETGLDRPDADSQSGQASEQNLSQSEVTTPADESSAKQHAINHFQTPIPDLANDRRMQLALKLKRPIDVPVVNAQGKPVFDTKGNPRTQKVSIEKVYSDLVKAEEQFQKLVRCVNG